MTEETVVAELHKQVKAELAEQESIIGTPEYDRLKLMLLQKYGLTSPKLTVDDDLRCANCEN
jgi:hypothetical protein